MARKPRVQAAEDGAVSRVSLLACLDTLARRHGVQERLEAALAPTRGATSLKTAAVLRLAGQAGLRCRRLTLAWADLARFAKLLPGIVSFTDGSRMILLAVRVQDGMSIAVLEEPREGAAPVIADRLRFEQVWTGELILVQARVAAVPDAPRFGWRAVARLALGEPRLLRDAAAATLALAALAAVPILFVQLLLQRILPTKADRSLLILSLGLLAAVVIETVFRAVRGYLVARLAARTQARLSARLFDRLLGLPVSTVEAMPLGEARHRFGALRAVGDAMANLLPGLALDGAVLLVFLPLMAFLDPRLTAALVVVTGLAAAGLVGLLPRVRRATERVSEAGAHREAFLMQLLTNIEAVKGLALTASFVKQWDRLTASLGKASLDEARIADGVGALALPAERVLILGTLALGIALAALNGEPAQVAPLIAFVLLVQRLVAPLPGIAALVRAQAAARLAVRSLGSFADRPVEAAPRTPGDATIFRGGLVFHEVGFRYPEATDPALRTVSFALEAGCTLGIMGRSGAGKTTIARLLQRLYTVDTGRISIDGTDIRAFDLEVLRRAVAVVSQTSTLFAGTIREAITAAKPDASFAEMTLAAQRAGADEFIDRLPRGYETHIHDGAPTLSAGQRQRLALARALVTNPKILVLDEALSALDAEIEATVETTLRDARRGMTTIIISHRLSSLMAADMILVMADGEVRDIGRHQDLLERCDLYEAAWTRQQDALEGDSQASDGLLALS